MDVYLGSCKCGSTSSYELNQGATLRVSPGATEVRALTGGSLGMRPLGLLLSFSRIKVRGTIFSDT